MFCNTLIFACARQAQGSEHVEAEPLPPADREKRLQRRVAANFPWKFACTQLKNSHGEIFYPVRDDRDRLWARRLEWVVENHLDIAEAEQAQLQADFEEVLRTSETVRFRKYDQQRIEHLENWLEQAHKRLRAERR